MERITASGAELEFETRGTGEHLILIHGSITGETFDCLLEEPALTSRYRVTHYHRRGFLGSTAHDGPYTLRQQAADARAVIEQLAGGRAHVAGHSYGGGTAIQLALDAPQTVQSLVLMEPLPPRPTPSFESFFSQFAPVNEKFAGGDRAGAIQAFLDLVLGEGWEARCEGHLPPGWFDRAAADIHSFFDVELPAVEEWLASQPDASKIKQPVLSVLGGDSDPYFGEVDDLIHELMPQAETLVVPGVTHGLQFMNPGFIADGMAAFLAKHPMAVASRAG